MKKQSRIMPLILAAFSSLLSHSSFSQIPAIEWQNTIGGDAIDNLAQVIQTSDGGYIAAGTSNSDISGDKTVGQIDDFSSFTDIWLVKLSASGDIEWQRVLGSISSDEVGQIQQTTDGGYVVGGSFGDDYYLCKLDASGEIEWERTYGSTEEDNMEAVLQTPDGGYFIAGSSNGDLVGGGDKTEAAHGDSKDYWVLKLDADGDIEWQNTIGGNQDEYLADAILMGDGGYMLFGNSLSNSNWDKTEDCLGDDDYWVVKINAVGEVTWQETLGGTNSDQAEDIAATTDGGFILMGTSGSPASADKAESSSNSDYWVVKFNSDYETEWENTINGSSLDYGFAVTESPAGGFLVGGNSMSPVSGDKTKKYKGPEMNQDYWLLKLTPGGMIEWQEVYGGKDYDLLRSVNVTNDNGILLGGFSYSNISGNKTEMAQGLQDYWIIKLEGTCLPVAETCNSLDDNCNGLIDDGVTETISISAGGATTFCQGGSVLLTASYSGTSVQWKKNGNILPGATSSTYNATKKGTYTCETSSACDTELSNSIVVTVNKNPTASISAGGATTFCAGGSVTLTEIPVGGSTYQWYNGASAIAGATTTSYIATTAGNYKCRVTKTATGCFKNSNPIVVTVPCRNSETITHNPITDNAFTIYPNPNDGVFTITWNGSPLSAASEATARGARPARPDQSDGGVLVEIYNSIGQLIYSKQINSADGSINETISLDHLSSGIYFVQLHNEQFYSEQKLIIE